MKKLSYIVSESIEHYLNDNLIMEKKGGKKDNDKKDSEKGKKKKKKKKFKKNAIKSKGGLRKDFDVEDDERYNQKVDDQEQSSIEDLLNSGFINKKKVAEKWKPELTPEGSQSELNKMLNHYKNPDSGYVYKIKKRDIKRLRQIIASYLK